MKIGTLILAGVILFCASSGCERWMRVAEPPAPETPASAPTVASGYKSPVVLHTISITQNGAPQNPNSELERRLVGLLEDSRLFSHTVQVGYAEPPAGGHVEARLLVEERIDPHPGQTAWRGFLIGASMFTLTSLFPLEYDYASRMTLEVRRWDGHVKRYTAAADGTAFYHLFGATPLAATELKGKVTAVCLAELRNQLVRDSGFFTVTDVAVLRRPSTTTAAADPMHDSPVFPEPAVPQP